MADSMTAVKRGSTIRRLAWATDIHLNFVRGDVRPLVAQIRSVAPDAVLITGDISEAESLERDLAALDRALWVPTFIVLGNHDFYGSSLRAVRARVADFCRASKWVRYLPSEGVVRLGGDTALVGHDGWADGRLGDFAGSQVVLNDYLSIEELTGLDPGERLARLHKLGDEAAAYFRRHLPPALDEYPNVIVATHVPPYREACLYEGKPSDDAHLPHFACAAVGEALTRFMRERTAQQMLVLCGHSHSRAVARVLPNLLVKTGGAIYGQPSLAEVIDTSSLGRGEREG
jgi:Icc-related predicted phosphoesterase